MENKQFKNGLLLTENRETQQIMVNNQYDVKGFNLELGGMIKLPYANKTIDMALNVYTDSKQDLFIELLSDEERVTIADLTWIINNLCELSTNSRVDINKCPMPDFVVSYNKQLLILDTIRILNKLIIAQQQ